MQIEFDPRAVTELDAINAWISQDNPRAARQLIARIKARVAHLATPGLVHMGRRGADDTRELIEGPYIIVYQAHEDAQRVIVLAIVHSAQDRS